MANEFALDDLDDLIAQYRAGKSLYQIARERGVSRATLLKRFQRHDIELRGRSDAARLRWHWRRNIENTITAFSTSRRGRRNSQRHNETVAQSIMNHGVPRGVYGRFEREIAALLRMLDSGDVIQQFAVDRYNLDIALPRHGVAVELIAKPPHGRQRAVFRQRLEYLLDRGWSVLFILWRDRPRRRAVVRFDAMRMREQLIAFLELTGRHHASRGQYRVLWGDGQRVTLTCFDFENLPRV